MDLVSLSFVKEFLENILREELSFDLLVNNVGIMILLFLKMEDGFEI